MDTAIIAHPTTWVASWHVGSFSDALIDDKKTGQRFRADKIIEEFIEKTRNALAKKAGSSVSDEDVAKELWVSNLSPEAWGNDGMHDFIVTHIKNNPATGNPAEWTECRNFNLMLQTHLGPVSDESSVVYMRPETCQSLFTDFKQLTDTTRMRVPFGMAQIGKAFRNEITPGQFLFRTREFEQMEIEYFVPANADEANKIYEEWKENSMNYWTTVIGIPAEHLRFKDHEKLAHYAAAATDIEYAFPWWFGEVQWIHNRTNFDLAQHQQHANKDMQYSDPKTGERYIPWVIEASFGLGRQVMASMFAFYDEEQLENGEIRTVVHFPFDLAPIKYAILPLIEKNEEMVKVWEDIYATLSQTMKCEFDASGNIGKRYRRQDEIGTPYCITIDHDTIDPTSDKYNTVTVRNRDTMEQERVKIEDLGK